MSEKSNVFTISSQKGGVGKTTTAVNLSSALSLAGRECLLVDLDPQGNATSGVGLSRVEESFLRSCLLNNKQIESVIRETKIQHLSMIPAAQENADIDLQKTVQRDRMKAFQRLFKKLQKKFDFIVIDCPPSTGVIPSLAFSVATKVLIPVQCEYYAMEGLSQILPEIEKAKETTNRQLDIGGLILTMFDADLELAVEVEKEVRSYFNDRVFKTTIPRDVALAESSSHGQTILTYDITSRGAWAYINLAKEVLGHE